MFKIILKAENGEEQLRQWSFAAGKNNFGALTMKEPVYADGFCSQVQSAMDKYLLQFKTSKEKPNQCQWCNKATANLLCSEACDEAAYDFSNAMTDANNQQHYIGPNTQLHEENKLDLHLKELADVASAAKAEMHASQSKALYTHRVTFDPPTVLALIDRIHEFETQLILVKGRHKRLIQNLLNQGHESHCGAFADKGSIEGCECNYRTAVESQGYK